MIIPDKYTDINLSLLNIGGLILVSLRSCPIQRYDELENFVVSKLGQKTKPLFLYALGFLYIMGKVAYTKDKDIIKLIVNEAK